MNKSLSDESRPILEFLAGGYTYDNILRMNKELNYPDIFNAVREALDLIDELSESSESYENRMPRIKNSHPNAYEPWSVADEQVLKTMLEGGKKVSEIAKRLGRQKGAINSRISKLGLEN